jgi:hypothetical protein
VANVLEGLKAQRKPTRLDFDGVRGAYARVEGARRVAPFVDPATIVAARKYLYYPISSCYTAMKSAVVVHPDNTIVTIVNIQADEEPITGIFERYTRNVNLDKTGHPFMFTYAMKTLAQITTDGDPLAPEIAAVSKGVGHTKKVMFDDGIWGDVYLLDKPAVFYPCESERDIYDELAGARSVLQGFLLNKEWREPRIPSEDHLVQPGFNNVVGFWGTSYALREPDTVYKFLMHLSNLIGNYIPFDYPSGLL